MVKPDDKRSRFETTLDAHWANLFSDLEASSQEILPPKPKDALAIRALCEALAERKNARKFRKMIEQAASSLERSRIYVLRFAIALGDVRIGESIHGELRDPAVGRAGIVIARLVIKRNSAAEFVIDGWPEGLTPLMLHFGRLGEVGRASPPVEIVFPELEERQLAADADSEMSLSFKAAVHYERDQSQTTADEQIEIKATEAKTPTEFSAHQKSNGKIVVTGLLPIQAATGRPATRGAVIAEIGYSTKRGKVIKSQLVEIFSDRPDDTVGHGSFDPAKPFDAIEGDGKPTVSARPINIERDLPMLPAADRKLAVEIISPPPIGLVAAADGVIAKARFVDEQAVLDGAEKVACVQAVRASDDDDDKEHAVIGGGTSADAAPNLTLGAPAACSIRKWRDTVDNEYLRVRLEAIWSGCSETQLAVMHYFLPKLTRFATRKVSDQQEAKVAAMRGLAMLMKKRRELHDPCAYLFKCVYHQALKTIEKKKYTAKLPITVITSHSGRVDICVLDHEVTTKRIKIYGAKCEPSIDGEYFSKSRCPPQKKMKGSFEVLSRDWLAIYPQFPNHEQAIVLPAKANGRLHVREFKRIRLMQSPWDYDDQNDAPSLEPTSREENPDSRAIANELKSRLTVLLSKLKLRERTVFELRLEKGLSFRETGEILGVTENHAKKIFDSARIKLVALFNKNYQYRGDET